uniref:Uncharacterized protein n=1 Tax=Phage sp. ctGns7 TaxID=2828003 RepID=A0A8S5S935_9VIRU|nr:MAG TPA: hypothetical protein [Phage sp. ctGns7]
MQTAMLLCNQAKRQVKPKQINKCNIWRFIYYE